MKKEDLVQGKIYRHPLFNFDIHFDFNSQFIWVDSFKKRRVVSLFDYDIEQLTEVKKIKVECDVWINVDDSEGPDCEHKIDEIFNLCTDEYIYFDEESAHSSAYSYHKTKKLKATFEEVDDE
jgi:hypothetical protein